MLPFINYDRSLLFYASIADEKRPVGKRTKTKNPGEASPEVENSSSQETSASKHCGKNLRSYWLMKSEPESRLEKGVDVKVRPTMYLSATPSSRLVNKK